MSMDAYDDVTVPENIRPEITKILIIIIKFFEISLFTIDAQGTSELQFSRAGIPTPPPFDYQPTESSLTFDFPQFDNKGGPYTQAISNMAASYNRRSPLQYTAQLPQITGPTSSYPTYPADTPSTYQTPQQSTPSTFEPGQFQPSSFPRVTGCSPAQGPQGTLFTIVVSSATDLTQDTTRTYRALFGSKRCPLKIEKASSIDGLMSFNMTTIVPPSNTTGWFNEKVPIFFNIEDENRIELNTEEVTEFIYTDASPPQSYESSPTGDGQPRKRRLSSTQDMASDVYRMQPQPPKRILKPDIRTKGDDYAIYSYPSVSGSSFPTYTQTSVYDQRVGGPGAWNTVSSTSDHVGNPVLVRTSTLQQANGSFNPYQLPQKANLSLQGDLNAMAENWTNEEWQNKRRLVQFRRAQRGNTVEASFAPVSPSERQANSICISCIWWQERSEAFVTSVDCIYLLEALVGVRFTVEEKNRIRRNLEGFHPLTVSKAKPDSESFFKLIMSFPNPKPRNIEKDVKVFPWKILTLALKKIIGKYSASYSSTASIMSPPMGSTGPMMSNTSPRSVSTSPSVPQRATASVSPPAAAHAYPQQMDRPAVTRADVLSAGHIQSMPLGGPASATTWAQLPHLQASAMPTQHIPRTSWDGMSRQGLEIPPVYPDNMQNVAQPTMHNMGYQQRLPNPYQSNVDGNQQLARHNTYSMS
ncbi:hypothetical protein Dda_7171 [Drechslerella dactyloides]|uniref:DUF7082 domain-containing protein n=1 Tax=Drechslerella dactyloides TaxID=74499 RepID=A0AAD6IXK7_DREDA|nr:hypothetical protein Dda_7171 [Drechslerella dactyloides]